VHGPVRGNEVTVAGVRPGRINPSSWDLQRVDATVGAGGDSHSRNQDGGERNVDCSWIHHPDCNARMKPRQGRRRGGAVFAEFGDRNSSRGASVNRSVPSPTHPGRRVLPVRSMKDTIRSPDSKDQDQQPGSLWGRGFCHQVIQVPGAGSVDACRNSRRRTRRSPSAAFKMRLLFIRESTHRLGIADSP